jgi:membrane-bound lytic murein transglycosylase D
VEAEETIGHYADWLQVSASNLRRLNKMKYSTPLAIGKRFALDFSKVSREDFEQLRLEFHRSMQEDFFAAYEVESTRDHKLERGDTLWSLARQDDQIPIWLLIQYNPDVDFNALHPGTVVMIPRIQPRQQS